MNRVANGIRSEVLASIAEMKDGEYVKNVTFIQLSPRSTILSGRHLVQ